MYGLNSEDIYMYRICESVRSCLDSTIYCIRNCYIYLLIFSRTHLVSKHNNVNYTVSVYGMRFWNLKKNCEEFVLAKKMKVFISNKKKKNEEAENNKEGTELFMPLHFLT